jgi:hypothetical protein
LSNSLDIQMAMSSNTPMSPMIILYKNKQLSY